VVKFCQALVQMQDVASAINVLQFYANVQPSIRFVDTVLDKSLIFMSVVFLNVFLLWLLACYDGPKLLLVAFSAKLLCTDEL